MVIASPFEYAVKPALSRPLDQKVMVSIYRLPMSLAQGNK